MELAEIFGAHGMLVLPSMLTYPARIGEQIVPPNPAAPAISLSGHPALSLPVPSGGLLPASLQLVAPDHHEARLLATAAVIEVAVAG
jgi:Asp-tRNA(Asn)/Glu-tRNA(Gln) amidotransferase A subunit family amidase